MKKDVGTTSYQGPRQIVHMNLRFPFRFKASVSVMILFLLISSIGKPAFSASFDCAKASTPIEKTICADSKLSALDEELARVFAERKKQLKGNTEALNKLTRNQRAWLASLKRKSDGAKACSDSRECLLAGYQKRIKELKSWPASSPKNRHSEELVMRRLSEQLEMLKAIVRKSGGIEVSETLSARKPLVCEQVLKNLPRATVPKPTIFANTPQQKKELHEKLREMAYHNQRLFFSRGGQVKDMKDYKKNFNYAWNVFKGYGQYDEIHKESAYMLFARPDARSGAKQPVTVTVLLDSKENGLSLSRKSLGPDGLWISKYLSESAYSNEYWEENLADEPQQYIESPREHSGLISWWNEVMFWELVEWSFREKEWILNIRPVKNPQDNREISCSYKFQVSGKGKRR